MGFKHVISADISSFHSDSDSLTEVAKDIDTGEYVEYPSYIIGEGSDSTLKVYSSDLNNGGYGRSFYAMFGLSVPSGATVNKVWCDYSEYSYSSGNITKHYELLRRSSNTWYRLSDTSTLISSEDNISRYEIVGTGSSYMPSASEVVNMAIRTYYYASSGTTRAGLLGGATLYVEYEDDTPDTHGIFNLILPRG